MIPRGVLVTGSKGYLGQQLLEFFGQTRPALGLDVHGDVPVSKLQSVGSSPVSLRVDCADDSEVENVFKKFGELGFFPNLVVHAAGQIHNEPLVKFEGGELCSHEAKTWRTVLDSNLTSAFMVGRSYVNYGLKNRLGGVVILFSSFVAKGNAGQGAYAASKAGVESLTQTWFRELGALGFRFCAIAPGFVDVPSTHSNLSDLDKSRYGLTKNPSRYVKVNSVINLVAHIEANSDLNGCVIELSGSQVF